jgi:iron complex outermembrane receptor protein
VSLYSTNSFAQSILIQGKAIDQSTFEPLIGASVFVNETTNGTITDEGGEFLISVNRPLPFVISVNYTGYKTTEIEITAENKDNPITVRLEVGIDFNEVVVSASRRTEKAQDAPAAINLIESRQIENDVTGNPILSLRNQTGVEIQQNGVSEAHISLRGRVAAFQSETFVIADYRTVTLPSLGAIQYGQQPLDAIDIERVEVVRGPAGALYGPGVEAGIVHFISKDPFRHKGTSISVGGGNQSQLQVAFRHANTSFDKKFGYKITGFYRQGMEFEADTTDPVAAGRLASYPDTVRSSIDGSFISAGGLDYATRSFSLSASAEYKFSSKTSLIGTAGYGQYNGLIRVAQGDGYTRAGKPFAQLRFKSGNLFAQAFWSKQMGGDGATWLYASGRTVVNEIDQVEAQIQYTMNLTEDKLNLVIGADYRDNFLSTEGTLNGRFEDQDEYRIYGAYVQGKLIVSPKIDFVGAARVDRFTALDKVAASPRLALVLKPKPNHTIRLTWNKAAGAPVSLNLHGDFPAANRGAFLVWLNAGINPLTFDDQKVYSFITQQTYDDLNFPLQAAYGAATQGIAESGQLPAGLVSYLASEAANVSGSTTGVPTSTPLAREALKMSLTSMYEIGYNGVLKDKFAFSIDAFYNERTNNLTPITVGSPLVVYPTAGQDLSAIVASTLSADTLAQYGLTPGAVGTIYQDEIETSTQNANGLSPLGLISSDQSPTGKTLDAAFYNIESIEYFGLDLSAKYYVGNDLAIYANYSWLSQVYWEEAKLSGLDQTTPFSLNMSANRARLGLEYLPKTGINANAGVRYTEAFQSVNSYWTGDVPASTIVDLGIGYAFSSGLRFNATVTNALNANYQPIAGATSVGRLILAKATYTFK